MCLYQPFRYDSSSASLTIAISLTNASRCCWKYVFSLEIAASVERVWGRVWEDMRPQIFCSTSVETNVPTILGR